MEPLQAETEQGLKSRGRFPPTVMSKGELVQVDVELRTTDAVMGPDEPLLQIADRAVSERHDRCGSLAEIATTRFRLVSVWRDRPSMRWVVVKPPRIPQ